MERLAYTGIIVTFLCILLLIIIGTTGNCSNIAIANSGKTIDIKYQIDVPGGGAVTDARVTLLIYGFDNNTNSYRILGKANVPNNPLTSSNSGSTYAFNNVPVLPDDGYYAVKTERNGRTWMDGDIIGAGVLSVSGSFDKSHSFAVPSGISNSTLYGYVGLNDPNFSMYDNRASGIKVTLYSCLPYDRSTGNVNTGIVNIPNNPQLSMGGDLVGMYRFEGLEPGFYNVTIEKNGLMGYKIINFTCDEDNNNWIMNNYVPLKHPTEIPTPTATAMGSTVQPQVIGTPIPVLQPTATSSTEQPSGTISATSNLSPGVSAQPSAGFSFSTMVMLGCLLITSGLISGFIRRKSG